MLIDQFSQILVLYAWCFDFGLKHDERLCNRWTQVNYGSTFKCGKIQDNLVCECGNPGHFRVLQILADPFDGHHRTNTGSGSSYESVPLMV